MRRKFWLFAPLAIVGFAAFVAVGGYVVQQLWNWLMPAIFGLRSQHQPAATTLSNNSIDTPNPRPAPSSTRNSPSSQWADESSKYLSINGTHEAGTWVGAHLFHLEATGNTGGAKFSRPTPIQLFAR